jgi:hypothetical protein
MKSQAKRWFVRSSGAAVAAVGEEPRERLGAAVLRRLCARNPILPWRHARAMGAAQALSREPTLRPGVQRRRSSRRTREEAVIIGAVNAILVDRRYPRVLPYTDVLHGPQGAGLVVEQTRRAGTDRPFTQLRLKRIFPVRPELVQ